MNPFVQLLNFSGWSEETQKKVMKFSIKFSSIVFIILYIIGFFTYMNSISSERVLGTNNIALYFVGLLLPLLVFVMIILLQLEDKRYLGLIILGIVVTIIIFLQTLFPSFHDTLLSVFNSFISYVKIPFLSEESSFLLVLLSKMLLAAIVIVALTIVFNVFLNESYKQKKRNGIFLYLLFYIPCLISDYLQYLFLEFKMTPNVVYVLLILEIIFILLYIYLPKLFEKIVLSNGITIVNEPKFLKGKTVVSTNKPFLGTSNELQSNIFQLTTDPSTNQIPMRNYSISMWVTVNTPMVSVSNETMIFRYGKDTTDDYTYGCPYIAYTSNDMWKIVVTNERPIENIDLKEFSDNYIPWIISALKPHPDYGDGYGNLDLLQNQWFVKTPRDLSKNIFLTTDEADFLTKKTNEININQTNDSKEKEIIVKSNEERLKKMININGKILMMYKKRFDVQFNKGTEFIPSYFFETTPMNTTIDASHLLQIKDKLGNDIPTNHLENQKNILEEKETALNMFITSKIDTPNATTIHFPSQRWNNLVFNYQGSKVDIFANGVLTRTINFEGKVPVYRPTDVVTIGNEKNNLHGAICNVVVYPEVLSVNQIVRMYNILELKNPPML